MFGLFKSVPSISLSDLQGKLTKSIVLLDVRTPGEYRGGHIGRAKNVPLDRIASYSGKKDEELFVICQSGMRSKRAAKMLQKMGYKVTNVRGGMSQWNGPVLRGK